LDLRLGRKRLTTIIKDDGRGFNLAAVHNLDSQLHRGLANMKKLAAAINADLKIESNMKPPLRGTTVTIALPISIGKG
jgi:signal transduction histidine kinase